MSPDSPIRIDVPEVPDQVPVGEVFLLQLVIHRPPELYSPVVILYLNHPNEQRVTLNTDLLQQEVILHPGECLNLTVGVEFRTPGPANLNEFYVQVAPLAKDGNLPEGGQLVRLPDKPIRVIPSFRSEIAVEAERICAYDQGVKMEVVICNNGPAAWEDFGVEVGPAGQVRAGVVRHRRLKLEPKNPERFEVVTIANQIELTLSGRRDGGRVEEKRLFPVPDSSDSPHQYNPFAFLEPRAMTSDTIKVKSSDDGVDIGNRRGVFPVTGGGNLYTVTIYPNDPRAQDVDLLAVPGQVEVKKMKSEGRVWTFQITTLESPWLTRLVRLYYDVQVPGRVLRGELYLAVRPSNAKLWAFAATAGAALTIKGITGVVPAITSLDNLMDDLVPGILNLFEKNWTDWLQLVSIPLVRVGLWILERAARWYRGW